jgi:membrane-associated phospholipid phosphatase
MLAGMPSALSLLALASLVASSPVPEAALPTAARQATDAPTVRPLDVHWARDGVIAGASLALWVTTETLKGKLGPNTCRWCDRSADGQDTLNPVDRWTRAALVADTLEGRARWGKASDVSDFIVLPVGVLGAQYLLASGSGATGREYAQDVMTIVESVGVAALTNQVVKFAVGRERPFVHEGNHAEHDSDDNVSFYSGHTSLAFSLVTAAGTVSEMRGYRHGWILWAVGLPAAASVGLMRIGADKHYLTDVLVGAAAGSLFGVGIPLLLHRPSSPEGPEKASGVSMRMTGSLGGFTLSGRF